MEIIKFEMGNKTKLGKIIDKYNLSQKDLADFVAEDFTTKLYSANGAYFIEGIEGLTYSTSAGEVADFSVEFEDVASAAPTLNCVLPGGSNIFLKHFVALT